MVPKPTNHEQSNDNDHLNDHLDEGWWASVLADEGGLLPPTAALQPKPAAHPVLLKVEWEHVKQAYEKDEVISLHVYGHNRGGLLVHGDGIQGFVPISHLIEMPGSLDDEERRLFLSTYIGKSLRLKVIECEPDQDRVVLSERAAQAGEGIRKRLFHDLKNGDTVNGTVTNITDFGVFVDLGGVEGLIHVSELSWGRVQTPTEVLQVGQKVHTMVLSVNQETSRVALSLKRLQPNPWEVVAGKCKPGDVVRARITSIMRFGAFASLDEGIEGLIHISSIPMPPGVKDLDKLLKIGQQVRVRILHIDAERRRLGLGLVTFE